MFGIPARTARHVWITREKEKDRERDGVTAARRGSAALVLVSGGCAEAGEFGSCPNPLTLLNSGTRWPAGWDRGRLLITSPDEDAFAEPDRPPLPRRLPLPRLRRQDSRRDQPVRSEQQQRQEK